MMDTFPRYSLNMKQFYDRSLMACKTDEILDYFGRHPRLHRQKVSAQDEIFQFDKAQLTLNQRNHNFIFMFFKEKR
jgi:hypothetical protein